MSINADSIQTNIILLTFQQAIKDVFRFDEIEVDLCLRNSTRVRHTSLAKVIRTIFRAPVETMLLGG